MRKRLRLSLKNVKQNIKSYTLELLLYLYLFLHILFVIRPRQIFKFVNKKY